MPSPSAKSFAWLNSTALLVVRSHCKMSLEQCDNSKPCCLRAAYLHSRRHNGRFLEAIALHC